MSINTTMTNFKQLLFVYKRCNFKINVTHHNLTQSMTKRWNSLGAQVNPNGMTVKR